MHPQIYFKHKNAYKHPHLNASGHVLDSAGVKLGWIKDGVVYNAKGEKVASIEKQELEHSLTLKELLYLQLNLTARARNVKYLIHKEKS